MSERKTGRERICEWFDAELSCSESGKECDKAATLVHSLASDLDALAAAREAADALVAYCERFNPVDDMGHPLANLMPLRALLAALDGKREGM